MMMRQDTAPTVIPNPVSTTCGNCGVDERRLLHNVRHRGIFRRLCTTCVLRLHPQSFCPTCFSVFHPSPPPNDAVTCVKCYSSSHPNCVVPPTPKPSNYICPICINPNSPIFTLKKANDSILEGGLAAERPNGNDNTRVVDLRGARVLLAAAKIAAVSMSKAAVLARVEAERRAKEAAVARKRAKEALEHVGFLVMRENERRRQRELLMAAGRVDNGKGGIVNGVGIGPANRENPRGGFVERVGSSSDVLKAFNSVDLREKERLQQSKEKNLVSSRP